MIKKKTTGTQYIERDWELIADAYNGIATH